MTSKLTRERLQEIAEDGFLKHGESKELARMALAAMDSESWCLPLDYLQGHKDGLEWASQLAEANHPETGDWLYDDPIELAKAIRKGPDMPPSQPALDTKPVAYTDERNLGYIDRGRETAYLWGKQNSEASDVALYRHAQPAPVVPEDVRQALSKMDDEIIAELDAEESVCRAAMLPAAPVRSSMPDGVVKAEHRRVIEMLLSVCGAAFELADDSCQQDVDGEECHVVPSDAFQKLSDALDEIENTLPTEDIDRPDVFLAWSAMPRAALKSLLQAGKSPAIPDGYVMVPREPTDEMMAAAMNCEDVLFNSDDSFCVQFGNIYEAMLAAAPQETNS
ncbi:hypothetical protein [Klebsiella pneumoniae]|uniref:hypothetical protein n=1 Tax=Klebsiella pneumoniae TaxID=573 RepID=UPI000DE7574B|nr:hypothetical protein [Klebsiella pneumoniae]SSN58964.1 Uncharacterised protein [Klebsiella pneumoniae]